MKTSNTVMIDNYFVLMRGLSNEFKIKLIAKLSNSMLEESTENERLVDKFYGAFVSKKSAEELIDEIKVSRSFNRKIETF